VGRMNREQDRKCKDNQKKKGGDGASTTNPGLEIWQITGRMETVRGGPEIGILTAIGAGRVPILDCHQVVVDVIELIVGCGTWRGAKRRV
jgi:hypothetical protein